MNKLTLEEAIKHLEDELNNPEHKWECSQCKKENEQVLRWLKTLKTVKEKVMPLVSIEDGRVWDNELYSSNELTQEETDLLTRFSREKDSE